VLSLNTRIYASKGIRIRVSEISRFLVLACPAEVGSVRHVHMKSAVHTTLVTIVALNEGYIATSKLPAFSSQLVHYSDTHQYD
jgi:hypothetical protein